MQRRFSLRMKAANTCNRNGLCLFPKNDSLRLQTPQIGPCHSGDIPAILDGRLEDAVSAGYPKKENRQSVQIEFHVSKSYICVAISKINLCIMK